MTAVGEERGLLKAENGGAKKVPKSKKERGAGEKIPFTKSAGYELRVDQKGR